MRIKIPNQSFNSPQFQTECERSITNSPDSAFRIEGNDQQSPYQTEFKLELKGTSHLEEEKTVDKEES